jgi:redox-sensing transcriptional repressor
MSAGSTSPVRDRSIPEATVGRLPRYLQALSGMAAEGIVVASSEDLALAAGVTSAKVRKDLSHLGSYGTRGVGYDVAYLIHQIRRELGLTQDWGIAIAGIGNLGHALANYKGFGARGFRVAALIDIDPEKVGERVGDIEVLHVDALPELVRERGIAIGVIATPATAVQDIGDRLVTAGIRSILNFAPAPLVVPPGVSVRSVDLAVELQILAYYEQRNAALADVRRGGGAAAFAPTR